MPSLPGTVRPATPGARGFDTPDVLTDQALREARSGGFTFCLRYLAFMDYDRPGDMDGAEAARILEAGLALMPIYPYAGDNWRPTGWGTTYGQRAVDSARRIGFPAGVNIWVDVEAVNGATPASDVITFVNEWSSVVASAGFVPGIYVGANSGLDGNQLYNSLTLEHYWKSGSLVPAIPTRGYQMIQTIPGTPRSIGGVSIDTNVTQTDGLGGNALWLSPT